MRHAIPFKYIRNTNKSNKFQAESALSLPYFLEIPLIPPQTIGYSNYHFTLFILKRNIYDWISYL